MNSLIVYGLLENDLTAVLKSLGDISTAIFTHVGSLITFVFNNPILLIGFGIFFAGAIVGIFKRLAQ